jgi:small subunit ribosomal protein S2
MKRFILCPRNGIYIIDLNKTLSCIDKLIDRITVEVSKGGKVLFVGTKRQIKDIVKEEAIRCNMPYVTERWLGGMLTNFKTIRQSISKLEKIEAMEGDGTMEALPKKEILKIQKKKEKLLSILEGIRNLKRTPALVFVVDSIKEQIAVCEARRLHVPISAILDTNCDPDYIEYPIPANDDAIKSVQLILTTVADTICNISKNIKAEEFNEAGGRINDGDKGLSEDDFEEGEAEDGKKDTLARKKRRVVKKKVTKDVDAVQQ